MVHRREHLEVARIHQAPEAFQPQEEEHHPQEEEHPRDEVVGKILEEEEYVVRRREDREVARVHRAPEPEEEDHLGLELEEEEEDEEKILEEEEGYDVGHQEQMDGIHQEEEA